MKQKTAIRQAIEKFKASHAEWNAAYNISSTETLQVGTRILKETIEVLESLEPVNEQQIKAAYWKGNEEVEIIKTKPFAGASADNYFTETFEKP